MVATYKGKRPLKLYKVYRGNKCIMVGNILEVSKQLDLSIEGAKNYISLNPNVRFQQKYWLFPIDGTNKVIYAMYRGEQLLDVGNKEELAKKFAVKPTTIEHYSTPAYHRKVDKSYRMYAVRLENKDIEELHKMNAIGGTT